MSTEHIKGIEELVSASAVVTESARKRRKRLRKEQKAADQRREEELASLAIAARAVNRRHKDDAAKRNEELGQLDEILGDEYDSDPLPAPAADSVPISKDPVTDPAPEPKPAVPAPAVVDEPDPEPVKSPEPAGPTPVAIVAPDPVPVTAPEPIRVIVDNWPEVMPVNVMETVPPRGTTRVVVTEPVPQDGPTSVRVVAPIPQPVQPASRSRLNPRHYSLIQWVCAVVGGAIGLVIAVKTYGWLTDNLSDFLRNVVGTVWTISLTSIGFFGGGGLLGWYIDNREG